MNDPNPHPIPPADETVVIVKIDPSKISDETRRDLAANAQLQRMTPSQLLASIINRKFGGQLHVTALPA